jgi:hypothetical protein
VFLGYSDFHKGYKCLDVPSSHIYILRDVIFDEDAFPFSKLHPNAGGRLQSDVELLHPTLITPATVAGVGQGDGQSTNILPVNTNVLAEDEIQGQSNAGIHEEATPSENSTGLQVNVPNRQESSAPCMTPARAVADHVMPREIRKRGDLVFFNTLSFITRRHCRAMVTFL